MIGIEKCRNDEDEDEEADNFGEEIIGVLAEKGTIINAPEEGGGEGDFDVLPGGFVDRGKEADDATVMAPFVEKVSKGAEAGDNQEAKPDIESIIHTVIIAQCNWLLSTYMFNGHLFICK